MTRKTLFALALSLVLVTPLAAAGTWADTAKVTRIEGAITADGVVLTRVLLQSASGDYAATCNADARDTPQVCAELVVGASYEFVGWFTPLDGGGVELRVLDAQPARETEPGH